MCTTQILYNLFDEVKDLYKRSREAGWNADEAKRMVCSNLDGIVASSGIKARAYFAERLRTKLVTNQIGINELGFYDPKNAA